MISCCLYLKKRYVSNDFLENKAQDQQYKKANIKILARAGHINRDLSHPSLEWCLSVTGTTERVNKSQAIKLFQHNGSKHKQTKPNWWPTLTEIF